ncbi:hypothetical protein [Streptosporangium sp. NPDC002721]|uniref:hypothetical protein n=1 Tax=Streptosporangium sp. NPDC002721 TaxID=3366188 RepID=UPI0036B40725
MNGIIEWIKQFDIDFGDGPAWVALVVSLGAFAVALRGLKWQRRAAEAGEKSADAAVRSANAAEKSAAFAELPASQKQKPGAAAAGKVSWDIQHVSGALYLLRNTGDDIATGVTADASKIGGIPRQLPEGAAVRPNESVQFMLVDTWQSPLAHELWLTWDGQEEPVAVPIPHPRSW